jgi:hypothetical protein
LRDYQGGYGERNLTEVYPNLDWCGFNKWTRNNNKKYPNQFIPVGQSFCKWKTASTSTTVKYKNSQRGFVKENESSSNLMFKVNPPKINIGIITKSKVENNNYKKIRLDTIPIIPPTVKFY